MKNSSSRNSNGMKAENSSTENLRNATVTSSRNDSSLAVEKIVDMSKPKRHSGKASLSRDNGDRKQTGNESSKLTYTSEDGIHYEPGGMLRIVRFFMLECLFNSRTFIVCLVKIITSNYTKHERSSFTRIGALNLLVLFILV